MIIGLVQHNPVTGDFPKNVRSLIDGYRECLETGASHVFSPALGLPGLNCLDIIYRSGFMKQCDDALRYMATEVGRIPLCVGTYIKTAAGSIEEGYAILHEGHIVSTEVYTNSHQHPTAFPITLNVLDISILIIPEGVSFPRTTEADCLLSLAREAWYLGKERTLLLSHCRETKRLALPLYHLGAVGANDSHLFHGESFFLNKDGMLIAQIAPFEETSISVDTKQSCADNLPSVLCKEEYLYRALTLSLADYCKKTGINTVCIGLSGGIDSALVAALAVNALGANNVIGITMPSPYSSRGSIDDSVKLAKKLDITCYNVPITPVFETLKHSLNPIFSGKTEDITEENMQSRIRGTMLMAYANKFNAMLLSTGNKSELAIGYCTLYGDTCGGIALLADLYKHQVYAVSRWINKLEEVIPWSIIDKAPSAELRPDQKDSDTLPPYDILDRILKYLIEDELSPADIIAQTNLPEQDIRWVQRRLSLNEWKRQQTALIPQVSPKAFGPNRHYPIVQNFRD